MSALLSISFILGTYCSYIFETNQSYIQNETDMSQEQYQHVRFRHKNYVKAEQLCHSG